jgi:inosine/xanthosine triphosphatase
MDADLVGARLASDADRLDMLFQAVACEAPFDVRLVAVGSTNPVKLAAVQAVIGQLWPAACVTALAVDPGVPDQPLSDEEMVAGAQARAVAARVALDADLGVGLEGGVHRSPWGLLLTGWVAVVDRSGRRGLGSGGRLPLPPVLVGPVLAGEELGPAMDRLAGQHDTRRGPGAVGILTNGLVRRDEAFRVAMAYAMASFLHPTWYRDSQALDEA